MRKIYIDQDTVFGFILFAFIAFVLAYTVYMHVQYRYVPEYATPDGVVYRLEER